MMFLEISKTQKLPKNHPKTKKIKQHARRVQMKKINKQTIIRIEKC
jgi:hypothetical protein